MFDLQVRGSVERRLPAGWTAHPDDRVLRVRTGSRGLSFSDGLHGLTDRQVDEAVASAATFFADHGEIFEWKSYSHDHPAITRALARSGFRPEPTETVLIGDTRACTAAGEPPSGVRLRRVHRRDDLERIAALECEVWDEDWSWLADDLDHRLRSSPDDTAVWVAEAGAQVVSAAWLVRLPGTDFAGLWGGSTRQGWRHQGIYRSLVAVRARTAERWGVRHLWVDSSDDSRPILERLHLVAVASTTPWISPTPTPSATPTA